MTTYDFMKQRAETAETRVSWLEQQREEECKQKLAALAESEVCLKETRGFKERAFRAEARVKELEAQNARLREALTHFAKEEVCPVSDNCAPGFVAGAYTGWGWARNRVGDILAETKGTP